MEKINEINSGMVQSEIIEPIESIVSFEGFTDDVKKIEVGLRSKKVYIRFKKYIRQSLLFNLVKNLEDYFEPDYSGISYDTNNRTYIVIKL